MTTLLLPAHSPLNWLHPGQREPFNL